MNREKNMIRLWSEDDQFDESATRSAVLTGKKVIMTFTASKPVNIPS